MEYLLHVLLLPGLNGGKMSDSVKADALGDGLQIDGGGDKEITIVPKEDSTPLLLKARRSIFIGDQNYKPRIGRLVRYKLAHVLCSVHSRAKACVGSTPCCLRYEFKCSTDRKRGRHFRNTKEGTRSGPMNSATTSAWEFCLWADAGCLIAFLH
ncbi:hypothetical protein BHE74_00008829 [Ensete ventricosum]|nr:hypothetical protein BHE74_00008829 [Ensete ventricosum]RZR90921.1 hypothetical protein BHM03_00018941 [Ensete ventricosum]